MGGWSEVVLQIKQITLQIKHISLEIKQILALELA
jgi:hypothetical protein